MQINRRELMLAAASAAAARASAAKSAVKSHYAPKPRTGPSMDDLARAAALPVLKRELFKNPVTIQSIDLLRGERENAKEYFVRVRSTDGAEGISVCNPPRADYFDRVFKGL